MDWFNVFWIIVTAVPAAYLAYHHGRKEGKEEERLKLLPPAASKTYDLIDLCREMGITVHEKRFSPRANDIGDFIIFRCERNAGTLHCGFCRGPWYTLIEVVLSQEGDSARSAKLVLIGEFCNKCGQFVNKVGGAEEASLFCRLAADGNLHDLLADYDRMRKEEPFKKLRAKRLKAKPKDEPPKT